LPPLLAIFATLLTLVVVPGGMDDMIDDLRGRWQRLGATEVEIADRGSRASLLPASGDGARTLRRDHAARRRPLA